MTSGALVVKLFSLSRLHISAFSVKQSSLLSHILMLGSVESALKKSHMTVNKSCIADKL